MTEFVLMTSCLVYVLDVACISDRSTDFSSAGGDSTMV